MKHLRKYAIFENSESEGDFFEQDIKNAFIEFIDLDNGTFINEDDEILFDVTLPTKSDFNSIDELLNYTRKRLDFIEDMNVAIKRLKSLYDNLEVVMEYVDEDEIVLHFNLSGGEGDFYRIGTKNDLIIIDDKKLKEVLNISDDGILIRIYGIGRDRYIDFVKMNPITRTYEIIELQRKIEKDVKKLKIDNNKLVVEVNSRDHRSIRFLLNPKYTFVIDYASK